MAADNRGFYYTRYPQGSERAAEDGDDVLVRSMSYVTPRTVYFYHARSNRLVRTELNGGYLST